LDHYRELWKESIEQPDKFWGRMARELLTWDRDFQTVHSGSLENGDNAWFVEGQLNASYNCVDRHAFKNPDKTAIIYEADEVGEGRKISYGELLREVCRLAYTLKQMGVKKGDTVALYMPMIPEAVIAFLACSRIGAVHSVVFAGFSSDSLKDRIVDADTKVVITTDEGRRGGKLIGTKKIVDDALSKCPDVKHCLVFKRTGADVPMTKGRDLWWHEEVDKYPNYIAPEPMNSEDPLFLLYTSGSTGKPKGVMHTTGGYLLGAACTGKYVFDLHDKDTFFCGGDVGWITGHTYVVYAPLLLGVATVVFEGTPAYPDFSRYWDVVAQHKVTQFYVAPTALRLLKRAGDHFVKHEMEHLRVLGSVGEPIAAEVWKWYFEIVGKEEAHIVDVSHASIPARSRSCANQLTTDILANRDWLARHHPPRRCHPNQARQRFPPLLRHRARHHRPRLRRGAARQRRRGRVGVQAGMAQYGSHSLGCPQEILGHVPECLQGILLYRRRCRS
jgi:acetyl-CoA synthetase